MQTRSCFVMASALMLGVMFVARLATAQVADHLQCHKLKDSQKFKNVVATLDPIQIPPFALAEGCQIKGKAKELCIPTRKTITSAGDSTPPSVLPPAQELTNDYLCYKVKCPKRNIDVQEVTDQFGSRDVEKIKAAGRLCVPTVKGVPTTTSTTTTTEIADCGSPSNPSNGSVNAPTTTYGSIATYSCNTGYSMVGGAIRTCQAGGNWSGVAPTCEIDDCGSLSNPSNGSVNTPTTTYGSGATYSCEPAAAAAELPIDRGALEAVSLVRDSLDAKLRTIDATTGPLAPSCHSRVAWRDDRRSSHRRGTRVLRSPGPTGHAQGCPCGGLCGRLQPFRSGLRPQLLLLG